MTDPMKGLVSNPAYLEQEIQQFLTDGQIRRFERWLIGKTEHEKEKISRHIAHRIYQTLTNTSAVSGA